MSPVFSSRPALLDPLAPRRAPAPCVASELRAEREHLGYSLQDVARGLNIRADHVAALEAGRYTDLPGGVYVRGFVAAYASFLQLDRRAILARFQAELVTNDNARLALAPRRAYRLRPQDDMETRRRPGVVTLITGLLLAALCYSGWLALHPAGGQAALAVPALPARFETQLTPPSPAPLPAPVTAPLLAAPIKPPVITIRSEVESWVQLRAPDGQRLGSLALRAGQSYSLPPGQQVVLATPHPQQLTVRVDGEVMPLALTAPRAEILLDADALRANTAVLP